MHRWNFAIAVLFFAAGAGSFAPAQAAGEAFYQTWSDGRGEVSTYELSAERYGQVRLGHAVLVYVAEELNRNTYVKVETERTPMEDRMFVIKLNKMMKFPTGLYDYSTMTSVFSVADSHLGNAPFTAARVTHSTQEWCGQVYGRLDLEEDGYDYRLHSYFEAEGDQSAKLSFDEKLLEDNLWVKIRELDGPWLKVGETRAVSIYPALWEARKSHRPFAAVRGTVTKGEPESYTSGLGEMTATRWSWKVGDRTVTAWVEASGTHRVLGWEDSNGGSARLVTSERLPYWRLNSTIDRDARERFKLPSNELR